MKFIIYNILWKRKSECLRLSLLKLPNPLTSSCIFTVDWIQQEANYLKYVRYKLIACFMRAGGEKMFDGFSRSAFTSRYYRMVSIHAPQANNVLLIINSTRVSELRGTSENRKTHYNLIVKISECAAQKYTTQSILHSQRKCVSCPYLPHYKMSCAPRVFYSFYISRMAGAKRRTYRGGWQKL